MNLFPWNLRLWWLMGNSLRNFYNCPGNTGLYLELTLTAQFPTLVRVIRECCKEDVVITSSVQFSSVSCVLDTSVKFLIVSSVLRYGILSEKSVWCSSQSYDITTVFKPTSKVQDLIGSFRDKIPGVYKIPNSCGLVYMEKLNNLFRQYYNSTSRHTKY